MPVVDKGLRFPIESVQASAHCPDPKGARSILEDLLPLADHVVLTASTSQRAVPKAELAELAGSMGDVVTGATDDVGDAVTLCLEQAHPEDLICVTGWLTTVGEARGRLRTLGRVS